jgi:RHS repeat-associated protein
VTAISGTVNAVEGPSYTYDANGSMTSGAGRTVTYTSFNMTATITQGTTTITLSYDGEHARVKMTAPSGTTIYLNDPVSGAMSEKRIAGTSTTWTDYIMADGHIVAQKTSGASTSVRYFVADHIGSVVVVMDETGDPGVAHTTHQAFDAWGKQRNLDGSDNTACALASQTTRGYTGHEQLDAVCLINANARIYDPAIRRFLAADTMIPDPYDSQSYNRHTYVNNRPPLSNRSDGA